ncbi:MAG: DUF1189 family protein [Candidatus Staskawiczbacteria bacterium]|nr:DUF1189 family protein [Candidatus Staskawiczbacteria bacterium]
MNIFVKIKNSIYGPKYYEEVIAKPFSYSFKYLLAFALLFALVFTIVVTVKFIPIVNNLSEQAPKMANYFPQELTITIKNGKVSTNVQEPYFIRAPKEYQSADNTSGNESNIENYIVIDTKNKFDLDTFNSYKTGVWLTADNVAYLDKNKISIIPLSSVKDFTLNRGKIADFINTLKPFIVVLYPIVFVGAYIIGYMAVILKMIYLLFGALLIWLVAKTKGIKIGYKKSYIAGMQLMTGAIIVISILEAISFKLTFPFFFTILVIIFAVLNLNKNAEKSPAPASVA